MAVQQRDRILLNRLRRQGMKSLASAQILDVGCGNGVELVRLLPFGARPENLHGIDLLPQRVLAARSLHPAMDIHEASAAALPWPDHHFDIVVQYTMLSSVLDSVVRRRAALEMGRVLRPGGIVLWYDFVLNPLNRDTHALRKRQVYELFPGFQVWLQRTTLAPPIARFVVPRWPAIAHGLQAISPLRSHLVGVLTKPAGRDAPQCAVADASRVAER
ncbi:class I SAM-dependent methyltransferase [Candidatus Aeolococcus gillhamiae]